MVRARRAGAEGLAGQAVIPPDANPDENIRKGSNHRGSSARRFDDLQPLVPRDQPTSVRVMRTSEYAPMMLRRGLVSRRRQRGLVFRCAALQERLCQNPLIVHGSLAPMLLGLPFDGRWAACCSAARHRSALSGFAGYVNWMEWGSQCGLHSRQGGAAQGDLVADILS